MKNAICIINGTGGYGRMCAFVTNKSIVDVHESINHLAEQSNLVVCIIVKAR